MHELGATGGTRARAEAKQCGSSTYSQALALVIHTGEVNKELLVWPTPGRRTGGSLSSSPWPGGRNAGGS